MNFDWEEIHSECLKISVKTRTNEFKEMCNEGAKFIIKDMNSDIVGRLYDVCGNAYIKFKDKRNKFAKEYKKYINSLESSHSEDSFTLYQKSGRQELRINKAIADAVADHLNEKYNANVMVKYYVD